MGAALVPVKQDRHASQRVHVSTMQTAVHLQSHKPPKLPDNVPNLRESWDFVNLKV